MIVASRSAVSNKQIFGFFVVWCFVVAFVLPNMFFAETLILFEETVKDKGTAMMPIWFLWFCGIPIFLTGLVLAVVHRQLGKIYLIGITVTTLVFLKLEYIPFFETLHLAIVLAISLVLVIAVVALIFRENSDRLPSLGFFLILGLLFIAAPLVSAKVEYFHGSKSGDLDLTYCFDQYVDGDPNLLAVFESGPREETKAQWGRKHFRNVGETEGRSMSRGCKSIWEAGKISFRKKPNLYVLILDALIPEKVADAFFGLGSTSYAGLLREKFYVPAGVTLTDKVSTKPSIKRFMWLDMLEANSGYNNFPGQVNSPLVEMLRSNGYSVTTGYAHQFWGPAGKFIDEFLIAPRGKINDSILCFGHRQDLREKLKGLGICGWFSWLSWLAIAPRPNQLGMHPSKDGAGFTDPFENQDYRRIQITNHIKFDIYRSVEIANLLKFIVGKNQQTSPTSWSDQILQHVRKTSVKNGSRASIFYTMHATDHTRANFNLWAPGKLATYRNQFVSGSVQAKEFIEAVVNRLEFTDPNALLVIAGDHGTYVSRISRNDEGFELVDRHSVAIGVWKSENVCAKAVGENGFTTNRSGYHTLSTVVMSLVECLADDRTILANWPTEPAFSFDDIGDSWDTFLARHLSDSILEVFKHQ